MLDGFESFDGGILRSMQGQGIPTVQYYHTV